MKNVRIFGLILVGALLPACGVGGTAGTLLPTTAPGSPTEPKGFAGNGRVTITWAAQSNASTFTVHRSANSGGPYFPVSVPAQFTGPTTYVDKDLPNGTTFYYVVTANNQFGESPVSEEIAATPGFTPKAVAVGPGASHCLAVFADGSVWGWGKNTKLQLGLDSLPNVGNDPVEIRNLDRVTSVAAGASHSLALRNDGTVRAWGTNESGQLGIGPNPFLFGDPVQVLNLTDVTAIAAGESHSLALRNDGTVWGWGDNVYGQVGDGLPSAVSIKTPVQVPGLSGVTAIAAGRFHSLALRSNGTVWGWGYNQFGQVGNGTAVSPVPLPAMVENLTSVTRIAGGGHFSLALREDGTIWSWGENGAGQLGIGSAGAVPSTRPVRVINLTGMVALSAGLSHGLAVKDDGTAWSWGSNASGELGTGAKTSFNATPVPVVGLTGVSAVSAGIVRSLALGAAGSVSTWGSNGYGELGIGAVSVRSRPTEVFNVNGAVAAAGGDLFSSAVKSDGTVWTWGDDTYGQLGNGSSSSAATYLAVRAGTLTGITALASGWNHVVARASDGKVYSWGANHQGQAGNGNAAVVFIHSPGQVVGLSGVMTAVAAGNQHSLALRGSDGALFAWGANINGQLGNGSSSANPVATPVPVLNLPGAISAVAAGGAHTIAIRGSDGTVWGWGNNTEGQLGSGSTTPTPVTSPVQALGLSNIIAIAAGNTHSLALRNDTTVWVWGSNAGDQLGIGPVPGGRMSTPTMVPGLTGVVAIAGGHFHSIVARSDGTVWAWGHNHIGQVGNGTVTPIDTPVQVLGVTDATGVAAGASHSLVVRSNGLLQAWGNNFDQELGTPFIPASAVPVTVTR